MITPTEADIGRRVAYVYQPKPRKTVREKGTLVAVVNGEAVVQFDFSDAPLKVISNLEWIEK